eukprot:11995940-Alexandrium_andersonii.AAC.1
MPALSAQILLVLSVDALQDTCARRAFHLALGLAWTDYPAVFRAAVGLRPRPTKPSWESA